MRKPRTVYDPSNESIALSRRLTRPSVYAARFLRDWRSTSQGYGNPHIAATASRFACALALYVPRLSIWRNGAALHASMSCQNASSTFRVMRRRARSASSALMPVGISAVSRITSTAGYEFPDGEVEG